MAAELLVIPLSNRYSNRLENAEMNWFRLVCAAVLLIGGVLDCRAAKQPQRPNVLFIAIDDLNDWIGCLGGHPQVKTPHIDRLAQRGIVFTNAHCAAPACNPSRAAVFSGMMPFATEVWSNSSSRLPVLRPDLRLLPLAFKRAGYATRGSGKLLHGGAKSSGPMFDESFFPEQRWSPFTRNAVKYLPEELPSKGTDHPRHVVELPNGQQVTLPLNRMPSDRNPQKADGESFDWGPFAIGDAEFGDGQIAQWSIDQLQSGLPQPFFMAVGFYRPHIPLWAPEPYFELYPQDSIRLPEIREDDLDDLSPIARKWALEPITAGAHSTVLKHQQWKAAVQGYLACISFVDHQVGRLLDALDTSPSADNTVIVLWSDHGWHLGEKQHWGKWTGWERSTRVPLIIAPPRQSVVARANSGQKCAAPVSLIDLYPTLLDLCDLPPDPKLHGRSLVRLLSEPGKQTERSVLTVFDQGNYSLRSATTRYVRYADGSEELYDLQADPHEFHNRVDHTADAVKLEAAREQLKLKLAAWTAAAEVSEATTDENGIRTHRVTSPRQSAETTIRVLLPHDIKPGERLPVIYVLPVEPARETRYGDGLQEVLREDLHNGYRTIFVAPDFALLPWYADHPERSEVAQESYFVGTVVPFVDQTYPTIPDRESRFLLGFSKSGWGAWTLLLRNRDRFGRAAAWDAPLMMQEVGRYGNGPIFGTQAQFEKYRLTDLIKHDPHGLDDRLILAGSANFRLEHEDAHKLLVRRGIQHAYHEGARQIRHHWGSGWVAPAVHMLLDSNP